MVKRWEFGRIFTDPSLKPVERLVHIDVLRVLVDGLDARIFGPRCVIGCLKSDHRHKLHYKVSL